LKEVSIKIKKCFLILELPPPVHGMTYINEIIHNDLENDDNYFFHPISLTKSIKETGKRNIRKLIRNIYIIGNTWKTLLQVPTKKVYLPISHSTIGIIRDCLLLLPALHKKKVFHIHGFTIFKTWQKSILFRLVFNLLNNKAEFIVICREHQNQLKKLTHLPIYILSTCLKEQKSYDFKIKPSMSFIKLLFISNISKNKGVFELIKTLAINRNIHLTIAGKIMDNEDKFFKVLKKYPQQCHYVGFVDEQQKQTLLNTHDIFILPSRLEEGGPACIVEAMQAGLPVIASNKGCIPDMIKGCGYILEERFDHNNILEGINYVFHNYENLSEQAKETYNTYYTKNIFINKFTTILNN
jgi:glycosyltransferase involved in cell wall biosynthesis